MTVTIKAIRPGSELLARSPGKSSLLPKVISLVVFLVVTVTFSMSVRSQGAVLPIAKNAAELWAGYDPTAVPLDIQVVEQSEQDGVRLQKVYFTSEVWEGVPVRIYAIYGAPFGSSGLPAVLHIHGGGQTASLDWVLYWTRRGYACATYDYTGETPGRQLTAKWGKVVNSRRYSYPAEEDPKVDRDYHWIVAARRAITFLASCPEVDQSRLGIFGISFGGQITWRVAGTDSRVRCAVPIYLAGHATGLGLDAKAETILEKFYDPDTYAPMIKCPVLYLSGSNDFAGLIDHSDKTLRLLKADWRVAYSCNYNHHLEPDVGRDLPMWMDTHLKKCPAWPKTPQLQMDLAPAGMPRAKITADQPSEVVDIRVHYNLDTGAHHTVRFWRTVTSTRAKGEDYWLAPIPVLDDRVVRAYCEVHYKSGAVLCSLLSQFVPSSLGKARMTLRPTSLIDDFDAGCVSDWFHDLSYTDPNLDLFMLRPVVDGPDKGWAIGGNPKVPHNRRLVATSKVGDPACSGKGYGGLSFVFRTQTPPDLKVLLIRDSGGVGQREYSCNPKTQVNGQWERITIRASDFKDKD
ncbi:MAG: acetylxylan esterase, partial [Armatimonadota bacterium]